MFIGTIKPSHCASLIAKSARYRRRLGTLLYLIPAWPLNKTEHASHAQSSLRVGGSSKCWCSGGNSALHSSHRSTVARFFMKRRSVASEAPGPGESIELIFTDCSAGARRDRPGQG